MKKYLLGLSMIFCLFSSEISSQMSISYEKELGDRYKTEDIQEARKMGEILLFEKQIIELGEIERGSFPEMTFRFLNVSSEEIEYNFFDVCSCSILTVDKSKKIKPGEEGTFHIKFDSKEREDEEPVEINFELKNIDLRNNLKYFYTAEYTFTFKK